MNLPQKIAARFRTPQLTRTRIILALVVAVVADGVQLLLGPLGWAGIDEAIDCVMMVAASAILGFHWLLLPTFLVEFVPVVDMLPTWTGCVAGVIALRKRATRSEFRVHAALDYAVPEPPTGGTPNGGGAPAPDAKRTQN